MSASDVIESEQHTALTLEDEDDHSAHLLQGQENGLPRASGSFDGDLRRPSRLTVTILTIDIAHLGNWT